MNKEAFNVHFPVELFEEWIKQTGIQEGQMGENQNVLLSGIKFDKDTGYIIVDGDLQTRLDA